MSTHQNMTEKNIPVIHKKPVTITKDSNREEIRTFVHNTLKLILSNHEKLSVTHWVGEKTTVYQVDLAQDDFGRLLGTKGKTLNGLRAIVGAIAGAKGFRAIIEIKEEDRFF